MLQRSISLRDALCGGAALEVPTIEGKTLTVRLGEGDVVRPGYERRLGGHGLPRRLRGRVVGHGDLVVRVEVEFPRSLTPKQKRAISAAL